VTSVQAIVLGIVQGLGEFLPISSSAHLIVVPWLLGWPDHGLAFDVALHVGTLAAVVYAFRGDWWRIVTSALRGLVHGRPGEGEGRLLWLLVLASIPGAVAGLALGEAAETSLRSPLLIATTMTVVGTILLIADRQASSGEERRQVSVMDALLIGSAQALAIVPGVSRSGATISMALFLGYRREEAARFSFLLATPIIFGAALTKVPQLLHASGRGPVALGVIVSGLVGLAAIRVLLAYVRTRDYRVFVFYRWAFAVVILLVYLYRAHLR
jgi:undecaprenyl-diphosphatase